MKKLFLLMAAVALSLGASAKVVLPKILGSNMVIQQNADVNLWGKADADAKVTVKVSWDKTKIKTKADENGNWAVKVATPAGSFDKYTISISDGEEIVLENVMIGDVWITSGQSNMEMPVKGWDRQPVENAKDYILSAAKYADQIRMFTVPRARSYNEDKEDCVGGEWLCPAPSSVANMSAVAYTFAYNLVGKVDFPIGIITSNWGGTRIESWMPIKALEDVLSKEQLEHKHKIHSIKPSELYCAMIAPIRKYNARGFLWYQGCSNLGDIDHYDIMQARMVQQWREDWGDTENKMPFYFTMIAPHSYGNSRAIAYPLFVECQQRALANIPNCAMAATTDTGEEVCIHPAKKNEVGERMAAFALRDLYGQGGVDVVAPTYESYKVDGNSIIVTLKDVGPGLAPGYGKWIKGFEIAGADKVFHPANAYVHSYREVKVSSDKVKEPVAVRYAFRNYIPCDLKNILGVPVPPFRSDDWNNIK
ncbi:MAG: sialate O-acetylesterase [Alistipes sp.]|nr:sialate O-acetylesterase [Alistipes sp.]